MNLYTKKKDFLRSLASKKVFFIINLQKTILYHRLNRYVDSGLIESYILVNNDSIIKTRLFAILVNFT